MSQTWVCSSELDYSALGTYLILISNRNRCRLHLVPHHGKTEPRVQSRAGANHKLVLLLHSRSKLALHWYVFGTSFGSNG